MLRGGGKDFQQQKLISQENSVKQYMKITVLESCYGFNQGGMTYQ
jgi:hypothetical protein